MSWYSYENGTSIGLRGSESGVIVRDEEYPKGARITLEVDGIIAPFSITCGVYGLMCHTRFFGSREEADAELERMQAALAVIADSFPLQDSPGRSADRKAADMVEDFVKRFP